MHKTWQNLKKKTKHDFFFKWHKELFQLIESILLSVVKRSLNWEKCISVIKNEYNRRVYKTLFNALHCISDPRTLSLSGFLYPTALHHHNTICCNTTTKLVHSKHFPFSTYIKMFHASSSQRQLFKVAELTFSQLTDIPSFIPH